MVYHSLRNPARSPIAIENAFGLAAGQALTTTVIAEQVQLACEARPFFAAYRFGPRYGQPANNLCMGRAVVAAPVRRMTLVVHSISIPSPPPHLQRAPFRSPSAACSLRSATHSIHAMKWPGPHTRCSPCSDSGSARAGSSPAWQRDGGMSVSSVFDRPPLT